MPFPRFDKEMILMQSRLVRFGFLAAAVVASSLLVTACGGKSAPQSVANLPGTTPRGPAVGVGANPPSSSSSGGGRGVVLAIGAGNRTQGAKFSACMRKNGVPNFPDPNGKGQITLGGSTGLSPTSPKFRSASQTCAKDLPNGGPPSPQQQAAMQRQLLAFAHCMRKNGVPSFPDPTFKGNGTFRIGGNNLNPNDPAFQRAQQACHNVAPFGG